VLLIFLRREPYIWGRLNASMSALKLMNKVINVRPVVSLAAKLVGSGPNRLKMVKLSHELNNEAVQP
jgi:hypothetical protein